MIRSVLIIFLIGSSFQLLAQSTIQGIVLDENDEALLGATIYIKGTNTGTVTDIDGKFKIEGSPTDSLLVSFVGYKKGKVRIGNLTYLEIRLIADVESLESVIVIGYGSQRKSDITGAITSLKPRELLNLPVSRTDQALQGRIAGVNVQNDNASPNSETRIRIRGSNSLLGNNNPLIVVDGFQDANLKWIHTNDIESIEVLKDASALVIYGAKGANGVILITTKNGSSKNDQALSVNYSNYFAMHKVRNKLDLLSAAQYAQRQNQDALELGGNQPFTTEEIAQFETSGGTDWQDEIFRTAWAQNHHLSLSGTSDKIAFFVSGDLLDQEGIVRGSEFEKYALRTNLKITPNDKLTIGLNTFLTRVDDSPITLNSFSGENSGSAINSALLWSPTDPVYADPVRKIYSLPSYNSAVGPTTDYNPVALANEPIREYITTGISFNGSIGYELLSGLNLSFRGAIRQISNENSEFINNGPTQIPNSETASIYNAKNFFAQTSYLATYHLELNNVHNFNVTALFEEQFSEINDSWMGARGFISNTIRFDNLGLGQDVLPLASSRTKRSLQSYMARLNYGFNGKYLLTLTSRWDASTVFGAENKWAFFPSGAIGWNIDREPFMDALKPVVSGMKIRSSYGFTGNQAIQPGGALALIGDQFTYPIDGVTVSPGIGLADRAANPNLKWETTEQLNFGTDIEFFNGRINLVADYYVKTTNDLLFERPVAQATGSSTQFVNVGAMENRGIELYLEGKPINSDFIWTTGLTFTRNTNKVLELLDGNDELPIGSVGFPGFDNFIWLEVGQPIGQFRGVKYAGVWQANESELATLYGAIPGSPKAVDQNNDHIIDDLDVVKLGSSQPDFLLGWNNTFTFKGFELNVFLQGVQGMDKLNLSKLQLLRGTGADLLDRWTPTHTNSGIPSSIGEATYSIGNSDRYIEDASYIRIKNISLGYQLPVAVMSKIGMTAARIYVSGYNLFTFTNYSGYDPESSVTTNDFQMGVDLSTFPEQKIYSIGMNVTF